MYIVLCLFLWCNLCVLVVSWFCPTDRLGSSVFLCRTSRYYIVHCTMDNLYGGWFKQAAFDGTSCMRSLNDTQVDFKVGLDTLGHNSQGYGHVDLAGCVRSSCF